MKRSDYLKLCVSAAMLSYRKPKVLYAEIIDPAHYGERIVPFSFEKTLVHELLHLKLTFWCQNEDSVSDRLMHQIIDDLARAFTEVNV